MSVLLLCGAVCVNGAELWGTDNQAKEFFSINPTTGSEVDTKCTQCSRQQQVTKLPPHLPCYT
jgi:hypothetical protein